MLGNKNLNPETINTYEWALDYRLSSSMRTAVNVYYYQIDNLISAVPEQSGTSIYRNNGNQKGYGSELEWNWLATDQWTVMGNYAWQHSTNEQTHQQVNSVPEHHIYAALQWQFMPNWQFQPQLNWIAGRNSVLNNQKLSDYETIDFTLRGKRLFGHLNLAASLRNAFDTKYYDQALPFPGNLPMPGRSFYLEASVNF